MHCHWILHSTSQSFFEKQDNTEDTVSESLDLKSTDKSRRAEVHVHGKARYSDIRESEERIVSRSLEGRKRKRSKRIERRKLRERPRTTDRNHDRADTGSSIKHYSGEDSFTDKSRKRRSIASRGKYILYLAKTKLIHWLKKTNKIPSSIESLHQFWRKGK